MGERTQARLRAFISLRSLLILALKPLGKSRNSLTVTFLYDFVRPLWNLTPNMSDRTCVSTLAGQRIKFRPFVMHDILFVLANIDHEPYVRAVFKPKKGDIVIDVGAHIGIYSLWLAQAVGPSGKVVALEPDLQSYEILKENVALNDLHNIEVLNVALGKNSERHNFYACTDPSLSGFTLGKGAKVREIVNMPTLTLDSLVESYGLKDVNWIKIDVEGAELSVLEGGRVFLEKCNHLKVIIESSSDEAIGYLSELGFQTKHLGDIYYYAEK